MMIDTTIGVDLAKNVFQLHGASMNGELRFRKKLSRRQFLDFMSRQPPAVVAIEACGSANFWARELSRLGHEVKLIPPHYVKPFVKRRKNDAADAEAIVIAAQRPDMRFVAPKTVDHHAGQRFAKHRVKRPDTRPHSIIRSRPGNPSCITGGNHTSDTPCREIPLSFPSVSLRLSRIH